MYKCMCMARERYDFLTRNIIAAVKWKSDSKRYTHTQMYKYLFQYKLKQIKLIEFIIDIYNIYLSTQFKKIHNNMLS